MDVKAMTNMELLNRFFYYSALNDARYNREYGIIKSEILRRMSA